MGNGFDRKFFLFYREAGAIILKISHGYTIEPRNADPLVNIADEALLQFSLAVQPGAWLVDVLPFREFLPSISS